MSVVLRVARGEGTSTDYRLRVRQQEIGSDGGENVGETSEQDTGSASSGSEEVNDGGDGHAQAGFN